MKNHKTATLDPERKKRAQEFWENGYSDYLAARLLLRHNHLSQGAILAATTVEKYLKAILAVCGQERHGHLCKKLLTSVTSLKSFGSPRLNDSFVMWLAHVYEMRYQDNLKPGFSLVVSRVNTLAELDRSVQFFEESLSVEKEGKRIPSAYDRARESGDNEVCDLNWTTTDATHKEFVESTPEKTLMVDRHQNGSLTGFYIGEAEGDTDIRIVGKYEEDFFAIKSSITVQIIGASKR